MSKLLKKSRTKGEYTVGHKKLPKDANGKVIAGPGRPAGVPNKLSGQAKENIQDVFDKLGGVDGMFKWANKNDTNRAAFYVHIYPKLIPVTLQAKVDASIKGDSTAASALERILTGILAARRSSDQEAGVVIDHEPAGGDAPQLVLSSKRGSEAA